MRFRRNRDRTCEDGVLQRCAAENLDSRRAQRLEVLDRRCAEKIQAPASFLPHGLAGGSDDARQPVLLSTNADAPNQARNMLIADGTWREAALTYDRSFYLFDNGSLEGARLAWKLLAGREGVERRYWAREGEKWVNKA